MRRLAASVATTTTLLGSACTPARSPALEGTPPPATTRATTAATTPRTPAPRASDAGPSAPPREPEIEPFDEFSSTHALEAPDIRSLALGKPPKVAVLGDAPYVFDGSSWQKRPLPARFRPKPGEAFEVEIYFGRDDEPRLMGRRVDASGKARTVYLRHKRSGWQPEPSELGPLASAQRGLYGLLGHDDPEVVCAPGGACLVKRVTGWTRTDADPTPVPMFFTSGGVYKVRAKALLRLDGATWADIVRPLSFTPTSLCHETPERLWSTGTDGSIRLRDASGPFEPTIAPLPRASSLYCAAKDRVWAVGEGGAAFFDGGRFRPVAGDFGTLSRVAGRGDGEVWLAGERGVFRLRRR